MTCEYVKLPDGSVAIVCGRPRRKRCSCGRPATRECDWKVAGKRSGTCDKGVCDRCTHRPAPEKDLCQKHTAEWKAWQAARSGA